MIPHRELAVGDWLQHEAFKNRHTNKRAEIVGFCEPNAILLYLNDEPGLQTVSRSEITRWWNFYLPTSRPDVDEEVPGWCEEGREFSTPDGTYQAIIRSVKGAWISYLERSEDLGVIFRMKPYFEFKKSWGVVRKPSIWEWLRTPGI